MATRKERLSVFYDVEKTELLCQSDTAIESISRQTADIIILFGRQTSPFYCRSIFSNYFSNLQSILFHS